MQNMTKKECCALCTQESPRSNLAKPRYFRRLWPEEVKYREQVKTESAMDWLYRHKIVFDVLPENEICCLETIATTPSLRRKALGNLTYLENEPDKEVIGALPIVLTIISFIVGGLLGAGGQPDDPGISALISIVLAIFGAIVLGTLWLILKKNSRISSIAAWAKSWIVAIREYTPDSGQAKKTVEKAGPDPQTNIPVP